MRDVDGLVEGFGRFREKYFEGDNRLYDHLKTSQKPRILVIACSDSRVDPSILFDTDPGDLFVVRNVANLVPPHLGDGSTHGVSAALEFAVCKLEVEHIVVLGHSQCGGIEALMGGATGEFISQWMKIAEEAALNIPADKSGEPATSRARACEQSSLLLSLRNLMTFPFVQKRVDNAKLTIHGWYFDLNSGELSGYDAAGGAFVILSGNR